MTTITSGNKEFLAVGVQYHSAKGFRIHGTYISFEYLSFGKSRIGIITIPHGNYKIIGLCSEIMKSEELADRVIDVDINSELDFDIDGDCLPTTLFASFMTKHSLTESTLIIEKI